MPRVIETATWKQNTLLVKDGSNLNPLGLGDLAVGRDLESMQKEYPEWYEQLQREPFYTKQVHKGICFRQVYNSCVMKFNVMLMLWLSSRFTTFPRGESHSDLFDRLYSIVIKKMTRLLILWQVTHPDWALKGVLLDSILNSWRLP